MKGLKFMTPVFAIIMIVAGLISCMEVKAGEMKKPPSLKVLKFPIGFQGNTYAESLGEVVSYDVDPTTGCIKNFYDKKGNLIKPKKEPPKWLVKGKETHYFGSTGDLQCQQGIIGVGGSPTEYYGHVEGHFICLFAWDPECLPYGAFYQPCLEEGQYPTCP
jgi:hypothetical protein